MHLIFILLGNVGVGSCTGERSCFELVGTYCLLYYRSIQLQHSLCIDASVSFTQAVLDKIVGECEQII